MKRIAIQSGYGCCSQLATCSAVCSLSASRLRATIRRAAGCNCQRQLRSSGPDAGTAPILVATDIPRPKLSDWLARRPLARRMGLARRRADVAGAESGQDAGVFRLIEGDKVLVMELFSLVEKPEGISFISGILRRNSALGKIRRDRAEAGKRRRERKRFS